MKKTIFTIPVLLLAAACAQAGWTLDGDRSALSFVSTKAINIAEVHRFGKLTGGVDDHGKATVTIALDSVDTSIELRDERMREILFDTPHFATASVTVQVDIAAVDALEPGDSMRMTVEGNLSLHGESRPLPIDVVVSRSGDETLIVASEKPVLVNATDFALADGVEQLRAIAGLPSISLAVPVSFVLTFVED